jgi:two-component system chemotaxis response regulator CheY
MEPHQTTNGRTLLIVDDSATMRTMVKRAVTLSGANVTTILEAADGREALDVLGRSRVDAVFTDINMPVMTGVELLRHMGANRAWDHVLRVIISTDASDVRKQQVAELQVCRYLAKPVRPEAVCDVLAELVGSAG